jgi:hypothetical protein
VGQAKQVSPMPLRMLPGAAAPAQCSEQENAASQAHLQCYAGTRNREHLSSYSALMGVHACMQKLQAQSFGVFPGRSCGLRALERLHKLVGAPSLLPPPMPRWAREGNQGQAAAAWLDGGDL